MIIQHNLIIPIRIEPNMSVKYHETQRMLQPWASAILVLVMIVLESLVIIDYIGYIEMDDDNVFSVIAVTIIVISVIILAIFLKLDVTVVENEIRIHTIGTRIIPLDGIERASVCGKINAVKNYGGWGIRYWIKEIGYIAPGCEGGVEIHLKRNSTGIMISSRTPDILLDAILN